MISFNDPRHTQSLNHFDISQLRQALGLPSSPNWIELCEQELTEYALVQPIMVTSCTTALEMAVRVLGIQPGDEVIVPSFTFPSTATAVVAAGAVPVFVDVRPDTLNINENLIPKAISPKTRAIIVVHYAGVGAEMDVVMQVANQYGLAVIEDAAQAFLAKFKDVALGGIGSFGCFSFHATKNIQCGEGGALTINEPKFLKAAHIYADKGTNRRAFLAGEVERYTWVEMGSSCRPAEINMAYLLSELQTAERITMERRMLWAMYRAELDELRQRGVLELPQPPAYCEHNGHIFYVLTDSPDARGRLKEHLKRKGIEALTHYEPLHLSPAGKKFGRSFGPLSVTQSVATRILRLPMWVRGPQFAEVIAAVKAFYS